MTGGPVETVLSEDMVSLFVNPNPNSRLKVCTGRVDAVMREDATETTNGRFTVRIGNVAHNISGSMALELFIMLGDALSCWNPSEVIKNADDATDLIEGRMTQEEYFAMKLAKQKKKGSPREEETPLGDVIAFPQAAR